MNLIKKIAATFVALLTLGFLLGQSYFGPNIKTYFGPSTILAEKIQTQIYQKILFQAQK